MDIESKDDSTSKHSDTLTEYLIIRDSILRVSYPGGQCAGSGATIRCTPGVKILHIKQKLLGHDTKSTSIISPRRNKQSVTRILWW